ncbi:Putative carboxylesterase, type B, carboxylesterase type B, active, alpha/Beta hydrolase [Septoria linicola]|uniref:Carboxylic ester hydrolase n=1 Tax=Septoria linicola TaxID=215465 RepID=A0A9Q9EPN9_9PEZI|nr:putative carboxylesterase, type B, carboxylesterase type B, active, alpha/Beta hydrolase [Septoria linicola]USW58966.1 Putative carboxylesterase, type B, carboxylesterase type B, active, alpha/Beta hydrolase [Septoria linicola]
MRSIIEVVAAGIALSLTGSTHAIPSYEVKPRSVDYANATNLPIVDLGYVIQRATIYNDTGDYFNFSNIRYAQPPTGDLRFRAPLPPETNRTAIETGEVDRICPQANPAWLLTAQTFIPQYLTGRTNFTAADFASNSTSSSSLPAQDPRTTEDCLFLDVQVPKHIFEQTHNKSSKGAPVLVWFYGGGYTAGSKQGSGNPAGVLARSQNNNNNGVVYVAFNYRLGAFGWLSGPTFQEDGTANAALYDQRLALEWIKSNIHKFGGDPERITVFGESAGGGSIMHQITAFGGSKGVPFQQAVPQSPGWQPIVSTVVQESTHDAFLGLVGAASIAEARKLPYETLQVANIIQTALSGYGQFTWGPAVDGVFVPQLPGQSLAKGQFAKDIKLLIGHNANEGLLFTSPYISNASAYESYIDTLLPTVSSFPLYKNYIVNTLYPASSYPDSISRASQTVADAAFVCNTFYLDKAFKNQTYAYLFAVPPALHGSDISYTFYNDDGASASVINPEIAIALQEYITHFAEFGYPSETGVPHFPIYGKNATVQVLNATRIAQAVDPAANERCNWWQKGLYY